MSKVANPVRILVKSRKKEVAKKLQNRFGTKRPGNKQFEHKVQIA